MNARARKALLPGLVAGLALLGAACGLGDGAVAQIDWRTTAPGSGVVRADAVVIDATATGGTFPLAAIDRPDVGGEGYSIVGQVRYEGVEGRAFLEMWSLFADGGRYFSRTLDDDGPLAALTGSSSWRAFELPFFLQGAEPPRRLEINVVMPGAGSISLGPLELVPIGEASGAWWSDRVAGLLGAVGGTLLGLLGGLTGWLVSRRRARLFVLGAMRAAVAAGVLLLGGGVLAVASGQPYGVWFALLLGGTICTGVFGSGLRTAGRAYADQELRRMRALDGA